MVETKGFTLEQIACLFEDESSSITKAILNADRVNSGDVMEEKLFEKEAEAAVSVLPSL